MAKILGIDLGTTNSAMAIIEAGEPTIIENTEGNRTTPSIVAISKTGERLAGQIAKRQAVTNPTNTIYGIKRFMGHTYEEEAVQKDKAIVPYEVKKGADGGAVVVMGDKEYRPEEVSAMILSKLKADAEAKLGEKITEAVITVPAYFNDSQRKATQDAGRIAGLDVKRIINEPTAAALAYGFNKKKDEKIVVYDFGGGTFDVSVLEVGDDVIEVQSSDGDAHMGGRDIDQGIVRFLIDEFKKSEGIDLGKDKLALQRLDEAAEKAKHELSTTTETEINIPFISSDANGPKHLLIKLTRAKLEELAHEFVDKSIEITKRALEASGLKKEEIDEIILVGGQTRMPAIVAAVKALFGKEPNKSINPDEVVALGAAIQAGIFQGDVQDITLVDVIPLSLGIETMGGVNTKLIEKNTHIPTKKQQVFSTAADNQTSTEIHIVQGERPMAGDNKSLGKFVLDGIPPAPRGVPQVEVTFDVDSNGVLKVTAKDKSTGKEQSIRIEASSGLTEADIERMQKEAEDHAAEDEKKKALIESRNVAEQLIYTAEKSLKDHGDQIPAETKTEIEGKVTELKSVREKEDKAAIDTATEALSTSLQKIGEIMQKAAEAKSQPADGGGETVRDAEVKDEPGENKA
ncbi:molecular chaperone DnaK [Candidatus Kaiserbacteria bacterium RIFCSPLOWO2_02_FULL_45_11b]|uniref:Chaperone protein DnaK n=1 Tax=Candidatus Kaiserbacteria bacterium RIFCSPLOWO2_12_FULL_45_26 TaxID=1798525 RepID=A0A1F6FGX3_9BACT|nr:MAG: molecular chaperone DnaK [Candidatus Kaiserbacteria bacterium RIFCSPHIGHO2_12_45_16]OGG69948.1 MAG: molecular chaperone DnaK [Candidatus Kaiserbacteria bacterium RIFCSPLOWO2_01_FULL_45_25]OGG81518.1 MAG: molecular chaperone DnaK [Candidatus Kaiserbacteria bacterium RIFCSPLOWO2_02_FULL_45_11b]OGG85109.1 MAG: molecular chaperone DnaK [Candidatus Kaiserbacteria bacterium RIFCSPLOWO2_12_FULL_45_26]